jgi:protein phosphatase
MGTTLTAAYLDDAHLAIAHVGDSRAYMFRDGTLKRLTQDHSLVNELVIRGKLTEEQAAEHPQRSIITRALGPEPDVDVDTWSYPVKAGDVFLLCSDGLTSMISEERVTEVLSNAESLQQAAEQLIADANGAGGRDNITVVLFRLEEVGADASPDEATLVGVDPSAPSTVVPPAAPPPTEQPKVRVPLARTQGREEKIQPASAPGPEAEEPKAPKRPRRVKLIAALVATVIVLFLLGGGGYLASRQLYFIGTNSQGIVTIYRGLPYDLPAGIKLYETFYVSGVPASVIPADRRSQLLNNHLRSEKDASSLVRDLELGKISK